MANSIRMFLLMIMSSVSLGCVALTAKEMVDEGTRDLISVVEKSRNAYQNNPEAVQAKAQQILDRYIDYGFIVKRVMGKTHYAKATKSQRKQFKESFTSSIVSVFTKGLMVLGRMNVSSIEQSLKRPKNAVKVVQKIQTEERVLAIEYYMIASDNSWKVVNVVFAGINLGKLYRIQFQDMISNNSLDWVISEWR